MNLAAILAVVTSLMAQQKTETFGDPVPKEIGICQLLSSPERYKDREIIVKGRISEQCPTGCWFIIQCLQMDDKNIKVEITKKIGTLPQRVGHRVEVIGILKVTNGKSILEARGIEIGINYVKCDGRQNSENYPQASDPCDHSSTLLPEEPGAEGSCKG